MWLIVSLPIDRYSAIAARGNLAMCLFVLHFFVCICKYNEPESVASSNIKLVLNKLTHKAQHKTDKRKRCMVKERSAENQKALTDRTPAHKTKTGMWVTM